MCSTKTLALIDPVRASQEGGALVYAVTSKAQIRKTPEHKHLRGQIVAATTGAIMIATERQHLVVPSGHAIWIPPLQLHAQHTSQVFTGWSAYIAPSEHLPTQVQILPVSGLLREAVLRAASWEADDQLDPARERVLAVIVDEIANSPVQNFVLTMPADRRLLKIARVLTETPGDPRSMQELASWAGIAPRTLTRHFTQETGMSFSDWRQRARLMRAMELLTAGMAVTNIALELGYDSLSAFIAMFRRHFGVPPSKFSAQTEAGEVV
ncbi:helix-turn-helix transcriptional regulator [Undibacterium sp. TS12]|uniref:helix-turn-helix domain-containing protein n=1 Tax=Undibacterium sp. TS12 TaxID=2908202 RepID=UPI001F4CE2C3|nr:helix-turn-helix transcriptional regulator [Undibacterium sp. TS12]MCH8622435.1 helix-turn-helix transcriptional regulator [Undibacterium sp. TS12]